MGLTSLRTLTFYWVSQLGMLPGTLVYINAGSELAKIESLSDILSPTLIGSFVLLGTFPLLVKKMLAFIAKRRRKKWLNTITNVNLILEHYPVEFFTKISFSFFSFGPLDKEFITVEGGRSFAEWHWTSCPENNLGRSQNHYALNCASMGCPNLRPLALPSSIASCFWNKAQMNTLIIHVVQKKQKNFGFLKFFNGIRMILAVMKQEFWFINRNM